MHQPEIPFTVREEVSEQALWERHDERLRRALADAVDEIGRKDCCFDLGLTEKLLSKKLLGSEDKQPSATLLLYCLAREKSGRLARLVADVSGYLPFQRGPVLTAEQKLERLEAALQANPAIAALVYQSAGVPAVQPERPTRHIGSVP